MALVLIKIATSRTTRQFVILGTSARNAAKGVTEGQKEEEEEEEEAEDTEGKEEVWDKARPVRS